MSTTITPLTLESADEAARPLLAKLHAAVGKVPNLYAAVARSPHTLRGLLGWDSALTESSLSRREVEQLNLHVSELNGCGYCLSAHAAIGKMVGLSPAEVAAARNGVGATPREDALLALARRVVRSGGSGARGELARARAAGVSDAEVFDVLAVVALKAFTNAAALVSGSEIDFPKVEHLPQG